MLLVSSSHRIGGANAESKFQVPGDQLVCGPECVFACTDLTLSHSFYNVNETNNRLYLRQRTNSTLPVTTTDYTLSVPPGNYSASQLALAVASLLSGVSAATYNFSFSHTTHKFSAHESGGNGFRSSPIRTSAITVGTCYIRT